MDDAAGFLITFTCYGERLHGDYRGSVERDRADGLPTPLSPNRTRQSLEHASLKSAPVRLDAASGRVVVNTITEVCEFRGWHLHALNVRTNHVHVVVSGSDPPERMMNAFKSWSTRRLRDAGLLGTESKEWTRHGSTKHLWKEEDIEGAGWYVFEQQGDDIGGVRRREEKS